MMKRIFAILLLAALCGILLTGCGNTESPPSGSVPSGDSTESGTRDPLPSGDRTESGTPDPEPSENSTESSQLGPTPPSPQEDTMYIIIGPHTLTVRMADNSSAKALLALLKNGDMTVNAHDYGNFEKVGSLGTSLPTNDESITTEPGDVILYQGDQITVYYDTNSWSFTRLGKVQGMTADELKKVLGDGDVTMVLSLKNRNGGE